MYYKTIGAVTLGILTVLVASAALENRNATATNGTLNGSFGTGNWYETQYVDVAILAVFIVLFVVTRKHRSGQGMVHLFAIAGLGASIALIISKWISQYRDNADFDPDFLPLQTRTPNYIQNIRKPVTGLSPACNCTGV